MKLTTGVTKKLSFWNSLLKQIGLSFSEIDWKKNLLEEYTVVIVNSFLSKDETKLILNYAENGGSILIDADYSEKIFNISSKQTFIKYLFSAEKIFGYNLSLIDLYKTTSVASNANLLNNQNRSATVSYFKIRSGNVIIIPGKLVPALFDRRVIRKKFYSQISKFPSERVSNVSKGSIRHFISYALEFLYHSRNLPFVSLWNFPGTSKNIFLFRIDTDFGTQQQIDSLYNVLKENNISGSWFVETRSAESWIEKFSFFKNQEIALHCYRHRVFNSYKKNIDNLKKGIKILEKASLVPMGIAAPFGEWNESFNKAAVNCGFEYSSEFNYLYDSFPQNTGANFNNLIQIPVHPVSFGRLKHAGFNDDEMYNYFADVIKNKIALMEPVIIYTHPKEERYEIINRIFNFINEMELLKCTFKEYSTWWKERTNVSYSASFNNNELKIESDMKDKAFQLRVTYPSKENYLINLYNTDKVKLDLHDFEYEKDFNPETLRNYSSRMLKDDILFGIRKRRL